MTSMDDILQVLRYARRPLSTPEIARMFYDPNKRICCWASVRSTVNGKLQKLAKGGYVIKTTTYHPKINWWQLAPEV